MFQSAHERPREGACGHAASRTPSPGRLWSAWSVPGHLCHSKAIRKLLQAVERRRVTTFLSNDRDFVHRVKSQGKPTIGRTGAERRRGGGSTDDEYEWP